MFFLPVQADEIVVNPGFEKGVQDKTGEIRAWGKIPEHYRLLPRGGRNGTAAIYFERSVPGKQERLLQEVKLVPGKKYRYHGWIKIEDIAGSKVVGASVGFLYFDKNGKQIGSHARPGSKGSGNNTHISFEICEDSRADPVYFAAAYKETVELTAYLCKLHGLSPLEDGVVIDHAEGYARGIASNHGDVGYWLKLHGKSMDDARLDVAYYMEHGCHKGEEENGMRYKCLRDVPKAYRDETIDRLVALGIIKGKGGVGENMIIDLGEDAIRILIYNDRAGLYPKN